MILNPGRVLRFVAAALVVALICSCIAMTTQAAPASTGKGATDLNRLGSRPSQNKPPKPHKRPVNKRPTNPRKGSKSAGKRGAQVTPAKRDPAQAEARA